MAFAAEDMKSKLERAVPLKSLSRTPTVDKQEGQPHHDDMTAVTKEVLDARLEAIEAKMDGRVAAIQASIDKYITQQTESAKRLDDRLTRIEGDVSDGRKDTKTEADRAQADMKSLKTVIIVTAVSTVAAILFGVLSFNTMLSSNMLASFESGKNTAAAQAEVKKQTQETSELIKKMREDLDQRKPVEAPTPAQN